MDALPINESAEYPGVEFTPPEGTVEPDATEGEGNVKWKKVGDSYTFVEFEGQPLGASMEEQNEPPSMDQQFNDLGE